MSLVSCKKDDETNHKLNLGVTAQASFNNQTLFVGHTSSLDGSTSTNNKAGVLTFSWI